MEINDSRDATRTDAHGDTTTRRDFVKTGATLASGLALGVYLKPTMQSARLAMIANPSYSSSPPTGGGDPPEDPKPPRGSKPPKPPRGSKPPKPPKPGR